MTDTSDSVNFAADYKVRRTRNTAGEGLQHVRLDVGSGSTESQVTSANGLPVTVAGSTAVTASSPTFATVGAASATAVAANSSRKGLHLVNTSSNRISLAFGATAVLDSGITLYPMGSFWVDNQSLVTAAVTAIASSAGSNLGIQEYV